MSRGVRRFAVAFTLAVLPACSLAIDLSGYSEPDDPDAAHPDATPAADAAHADTSVLVLPDATPPPCVVGTAIDTPLTSTFDGWLKQSSQNPGYPKIESFFGMPAGVLFPFVDTTPVPVDAGPDADGGFTSAPERHDAISGIWWKDPVPLESFDLAFEMYVKCTNGGSCADGLAFAWLDTQSRAGLTNENSGGEQGIPSSVSGAAFLADTFRNNDPDESDDPPVPALEVVRIDGTKPIPEKYPWIATSKGVAFLSAWHAVTISLRGTSVNVTYDGNAALSTTVSAVKTGLIGFSGGTGGESDAVAVRNVKGSFYACAP